MIWRLLFRSWANKFASHSLAMLTVLLATSLIAALLLVSIDVGDKMAKELKSYGSNILVEPASRAAVTDSFAGERDLLKSKDFLAENELLNVKEIFWRNNILAFAPILGGEITVDGEAIKLEGTFFAQPLAIEEEPDYETGQKDLSPFWQIQGRYPTELLQADKAPNEVLIGVNLANRYGWKIGDSLSLVTNTTTQQAVVVGILTSGAKEDSLVLAPLKLAQDLFSLPGKIQAIQISALSIPESEVSKRARLSLDLIDNEEYDKWYCSAYVSSIAYQLEEVISGAVAKPVWQVAASEGAVIKKIQLLLLVVTMVAFFAASMGIASLTIGNIMQRSKEIGLMKALGAKEWQISLLFYLEAIGNALVGGSIGCLIGIGLANFISQQLFSANVVIVWVVLPTVLFLGVIIAWLGTWLASKKIAQLYPAEILYGKG